MTNYQGSQDCEPIDRSPSESCTLHLQQITEPASVQKFLDRIMHYQVDPAQIGGQIYKIIATSSDGETLLQIANTLGAACQADYCFVTAVTDNQIAIPNAGWRILSDRTNSTFVSDATVGLTEITRLNSPLSLIEHPIFANLLADGETIAISDIDEQTTNTPNPLTPPLPFRAILASPVRFGGAINGMIMLGKWQPHQWSTTSQQCIELASDAIASAIAHIQKNQEITNLNQQLQQQAKHKNLLSSVAKEINTNSEIHEILQQVIESTADILEVDRVQILLLKYTGQPLKPRSSNQTPKTKVELICEYSRKEYQSKQSIKQNISEKQNSKTTKNNQDKTANSKSKIPNAKSNNYPAFWISESSLCQQAFNSAPKPLAISDAGELISNQQQKSAEILNLQDSRALLLLPLVSVREADTVLGFIVLQHSSPRTWGPEELDDVELVATQVSTAIIQNQTIKDLQALVKDSMSQLEQSLDIQGQLYEQSANQLEQLRKWKQIKDDFLDCVNHELRTPLTIMKLAIVMLKQAEQPLESRAKYLDILEQKCLQEIGLIEDLLAVKQFESQQVPICLLPINIKYLIQDFARDFEKKWEHRGLALMVELPQSLSALESDRDSLNRILLELLVNAGKHSAFGTTIVLHVSEVADGIVVSVSNLGRGIFADDLPHIFDKFYRGTGVAHEVIPGMGLGLALVKYLVKHLNGTIEVDSCPSENSEDDELWRTSFTLTLPVLNHR
ncbi:GAF domain-containing sensor histidine kinase [Tychonema sp. BBK16]|uniref:GAF domain-containing sensor histidine kinase n=1 Tax=Tychonema sp. BBK16 TaxID=2699888 RepID=UPI001F2ACF57|nr:GAF domain-containing sensor histidine kinase [Tychonema sp. BBK16]MCF6374540.1 GAF domain-containing sensor histidine kinase [Tychonema sp. BBK16]